jgi:putative copper resistance protein D
MTALDGWVVAVRAASFIAALHAIGVPLFLSHFGAAVPRVRDSLRTLAASSAWLGLALVILYQLSEPIRLLGGLEGLFDFSLQRELLESPLGTATVVRAFGLLLVALGCRREGRERQTAALIGSTLVAVSFAFMGHTTENDHRWLTTVALLIHVLVVAFWFGSLLPLYRATRHETLIATGELIDAFSRVAVRLVPGIFVAGVLLAATLLPSFASLKTDYGVLLLSKVAGFSLLMGFAAYNKLRLGPSIRAGQKLALRSFQIVVLIEWAVIAAVIAVTATMTGLFSPTD